LICALTAKDLASVDVIIPPKESFVASVVEAAESCFCPQENKAVATAMIMIIFFIVLIIFI
jgi:hypothetical protein